MSLYAITGISVVFCCISLALDGHRKDLRSYNNDTITILTLLGCRAPDLEWRSSYENLEEDPRNSYNRAASRSVASKPPLVLTSYIRRKKFQEGIEAAKVSALNTKIKVESYSGFFKVNNRDKSKSHNMFFWYFSPMSEEYKRKPDTPLIMWIQGGMFESGLLAAFRENGPIRLQPNGTLITSKWSWAEQAHLVYFDSPVGVGYSHTKSGEYRRNQEEVASDLYSALRQFLRLFGLMKNPFFIAGQDYAGKTVAALGALIHNRKKAFPVNFHGVAIGNGFVDPPNMLEYGKFLYQLGFIDEKMRNELHSVRNEIQTFLAKNMQIEAMELYSKYIQDTLKPSFIDRETALPSKLDFTQIARRLNEEELLNKHLNAPTIQAALHATDTPFIQNNPEVLKALRPDLLKSQILNLKVLMNHYRVLLYHGQMSVQNAYPLVLEYLRKLRWQEGRKYRQAERVQWRVKGKLAGYFKTGGRFTELLMRNAGCHISVDQPKWAQHMINKFIHNKDFNSD